jgi:hypothetical protein
MRWLWIVFLAGVCVGCNAHNESPVDDVAVELVVEEQSFPVHDAARIADVDALDNFLDEGIALDELDAMGYTPLFLAVEKSQVISVEWLLERGVDVNGAPGMGKPPLNRAIEVASGLEVDMEAWQRARDIIEVLLEHGATPHEHLNGYPSAVQRAMDLQCEWCVSLMKDVTLKRGAALGGAAP